MDYHSVSCYLFSNLLAITPGATTVLIFIAIFLFILSFLVAGSEVAFFSLSNKDINVLKTKRQPSFRRIVHLLEQPKTLLAGMRITNSFVNLGIILVCNILFDTFLEGYNFWPLFIIKLISVAFLIILFAEVLPKVWATHHRVWFASTASLVIEVCNSIFFRLSRRFVRLGERVERRMQPEVNLADRSNIDNAIDLLPEHEATIEEKKILKGIRKFGGTSVKQIMRTRMDVSGIEVNSTFPDVIRRIEELHYSRLPVYRNNLDEITGILHTKDVLPHLANEPGFDWKTILRQPYFVHEQKLIEDLLQEFRQKRIHFAVVVDEFGGTSGIVTLEDIMEEVIGEIEDEFDDEESVNRKIDDHNYIFEGKTMIHDACKAMKLSQDTFELIRGDSDSLAGLVLEIAGEFPEVNSTVEAGDFTFIPLEITRNRIDKVKVVINQKEEEV